MSETFDSKKLVDKLGSFDTIVDEVNKYKASISQIPVIARQDEQNFYKAWKTVDTEKPTRAPKSAFFDPLSLQYALGYKDRRYSLTYEMLKGMSVKLSFVAAIINTRIAQIASFSMPYRKTKSLGYIIRHKEPERLTTDAERDFITKLEAFVADCGEPGRQNPFSRILRPKFEYFLKQIVRDSLQYDQTCFEIIPRNNQLPFEFRAVDSATIRIASPDRDSGAALTHSYHQRNLIPGMTGPVPYRYGSMYIGQQYGADPSYSDYVHYVQIINGQIENIYNAQELAFGIRNPRTDIYVQGYGFGEMEQLITIITSMLYAEEYNQKFFIQGAHPKGILNFKGDNWTPDTLEAFKRQWVAQVAGVSNAWKTPITQSEGLEWVNMQMTNQDMQFNVWLEYLMKVTCAVFLIDPAEVNFDMHGGVQQTPLFESSQEWKLKASRDRGLKPLLRFIAGLINEHVIDQIDDHFVFEFMGLDELTEQEKHEMMKEQIGSYLTLNEARRTLDLPDIEGGVGEVPLNPVLIQFIQFLDAKQQREQQMAQEAQQQQEQLAQQQQESQEQVGQQGQEQSQQEGKEAMSPAMEELMQTRILAAHQKMEQQANKHPLDLEYLKQKIIQGGGTPPPEIDEAIRNAAQHATQLSSQFQGQDDNQQTEPEVNQDQQMQQDQQGQLKEQSKYTDLLGKSSIIDFDTWLDIMRSKL